VALYLDNKMYHESLGLISQLLTEPKRLDAIGGSTIDGKPGVSCIKKLAQS
jgi:hypothetical protein